MRPAALLVLLAFVSACDSGAGTPAATALYVGDRGAGEADGTVTRVDLASGATETLGGFGGRVRSVAVRGRRLVVLVERPASGEEPQGRVVVVDLDTGARTEAPVDSPRSLDVVGGTAYVTSAAALSLTPVFLATGQAGPVTFLEGRPDGVAVVGSRVYLATWDEGVGDDVRVVSAENGAVVEAIEVGCDGPRALLVDADGEIWAFCTGRPATADTPATNGQAVILDGATGAVVARVVLDAPLGTAGLGQDAAMGGGEAYAVVGSGLARFDTEANALAGRVEVGGDAIVSVAFDAAADRLYLGRPGPDGSSGSVTAHDRTGAELARYPAGATPTALALEADE